MEEAHQSQATLQQSTHSNESLGDNTRITREDIIEDVHQSPATESIPSCKQITGESNVTTDQQQTFQIHESVTSSGSNNEISGYNTSDGQVNETNDDTVANAFKNLLDKDRLLTFIIEFFLEFLRIIST